MNIYLELTAAFNAGRLRAIICSGQAVVLHKLAVMSKDGDWILREDQETLDHILSTLENYGAIYRFGAPMDLRWMRGGWSCHFEFFRKPLRVRADFFTRPPRLEKEAVSRLWETLAGRHPPFVGLRELAEMKMTNREKDYAVIGELARCLTSPEEKFLYSRSARDLLALKQEYPDAWTVASKKRPALEAALHGRETLEAALDRERRELMRQNEARLDRYEMASASWATAWPDLRRRISSLPLRQSHQILCEAAEGLLPHEP